MPFVRVEFRLPTDTTIAYVQGEPRRGQSVRGLAGEHFVVSRVDPDGTGGYIATCIPREAYTRIMARATNALEELGEQVAKVTHLLRDSIRE